jgi:hypothetical protein
MKAVKTVCLIVATLMLAGGCAKKMKEAPAVAPTPVAGAEKREKRDALPPSPEEMKTVDRAAGEASPAGGEGGRESAPIKNATEVPGMNVPAADVADIAGELKLIKTASLRCEVADVDRGFEDVAKIAKAERGIVVGTSRATADEGYAYGAVTIKVTPERYDETIRALRKVGRLLEENSSTQDVTAEYVDVQARLNNAEATRDRYLTILKEKSASVHDILEVEGQLERVTEKIELYKGQIRLLDTQIGLSTITVNLEEPHATLPGGYSFGKALKDALRIAIRIAIFMVQAAIVLLPFVILLGILLLVVRFIIWFVQRRQRKVKEAATA